MTIVSDSSPLIGLERVSKVEILRELYDTVAIPPAVDREVYGASGSDRPEWVIVTSLKAAVPQKLAEAKRLGTGEKEAIALAAEVEARLLILDDRAARRLAEEMGIVVVGVVGVLMAARSSGLLAEVGPVLDELIENGFRVSQALRVEIIRRERGAE